MFSQSQHHDQSSPLSRQARPQSSRTSLNVLPTNQHPERLIKHHSLPRIQPTSNSLSTALPTTNTSNGLLSKHSSFSRQDAPSPPWPSSSPVKFQAKVSNSSPTSYNSNSRSTFTSSSSSAAQKSPSTTFRSELFMSLNRDDDALSARKLSESTWDDLERRRAEWSGEVNRIRRNHFLHHPISEQSLSSNSGSSSPSTTTSDNLKGCLRFSLGDDSPQASHRQFSVSFDVSQFRPEEISVRTHNRKLVVHAKHEETCATPGGTAVNREFNRQIDVPRNVEPGDLHCTLLRNGNLLVEADVRPDLNYTRRRHSASLTRGVQHRTDNPTSYPTTSASVCSGPFVNEEDGVQKFKICVDIGADFRPEELSIKTIDRKLIVLARHEESEPGRSSCKEFNRQFELPLVVDPTTVTANMSQDGMLLLEAPISSYTHGLYTGSPVSEESLTFSYG